MADLLHTHIDALVAQHPRFAPCLTPRVPVVSPSDPHFLTAAIAAATEMFSFEDDKAAAQVWLFSFLGSVVAPSVRIMVGSGGEVIPNLKVEQVWHQDDDGYWCGWRPDHVADSPRASARNLAVSLDPCIKELCRLAGVRPAPLWALVADGVVQPAMAAGNDEFEQQLAVDIAQELFEGVAEVAPVPKPQFAEIIDESAMKDLTLPLRHEPDYVLAHRVSCCKIYRSPQAEKCTSCPLQDKDFREAALIHASRF